MNLATLLSRRGRNDEAEKILREAAELQPTWGQVHYSLGLLAEDRNRLPEAIRSLERHLHIGKIIPVFLTTSQLRIGKVKKLMMPSTLFFRLFAYSLIILNLFKMWCSY